MHSMNIFRKCTQLITQYNKTFICPLTTSCAMPGKHKYTIPIRDIMIANQKARKHVEKMRNIIGLPDPNKDRVDIFFENKNPRHMELCGFNKPSGFTTLNENRNFYNKLHLNVTNSHVKAFVENINGQIICHASTTEFAIAKRLHSTTDVSAVVNIARILAERLKKTGLVRVQWHIINNRTTEKVREFEGVLIKSGIVLSEAPTQVLHGPPQTLPPRKQKRVLPVDMTRGLKNKGTINRKDKRMKTRH